MKFLPIIFGIAVVGITEGRSRTRCRVDDQDCVEAYDQSSGFEIHSLLCRSVFTKMTGCGAITTVIIEHAEMDVVELAEWAQFIKQKDKNGMKRVDKVVLVKKSRCFGPQLSPLDERLLLVCNSRTPSYIMVIF